MEITNNYALKSWEENLEMKIQLKVIQTVLSVQTAHTDRTVCITLGG